MRSSQGRKRDNCKEDVLFFLAIVPCVSGLIKSHERLGEWSDSKVIKLGIDPRGDLDTHLPD